MPLPCTTLSSFDIHNLCTLQVSTMMAGTGFLLFLFTSTFSAHGAHSQLLTRRVKRTGVQKEMTTEADNSAQRFQANWVLNESSRYRWWKRAFLVKEVAYRKAQMHKSTELVWGRVSVLGVLKAWSELSWGKGLWFCQMGLKRRR